VRTLVLEGSTMLGLDVHMNCRLILLGKRAMGALKLSVCRAQILESHFGDSLCCGCALQFFASLLNWLRPRFAQSG
jgi:hypothetical protein